MLVWLRRRPRCSPSLADEPGSPEATLVSCGAGGTRPSEHSSREGGKYRDSATPRSDRRWGRLDAGSHGGRRGRVGQQPDPAERCVWAGYGLHHEPGRPVLHAQRERERLRVSVGVPEHRSLAIPSPLLAWQGSRQRFRCQASKGETVLCEAGQHPAIVKETKTVHRLLVLVLVRPLVVLLLLTCSQQDDRVQEAPVRSFSYNTPSASVVQPLASEPDTLAVAATYGDTTAFARIQAIFETGSHFLIADGHSSPHVAVADRANGFVSHWVGLHGRGPRQFSDPAGFNGIVGNENGAWIHDFGNQRLSRLEVNSEGRARIVEEIDLGNQEDVENVAWIGDSIVATVIGNRATLMFFDDAGRPLSRVSLEEPFGTEDISHGTGRFMLNRASMAVHPLGARIALGYYSAAQIVVLDGAGVPIATLQGPRDVQVSYRVSDGRFRWSDGNQFAYTRLMATPGHIIALFCGCTYRYSDSGSLLPPDIDPSLHVFTWDGEFVGEHSFGADVLASSLAVSRDGAHIYGALKSPDSRIIQWKLPQSVGRNAPATEEHR